MLCGGCGPDGGKCHRRLAKVINCCTAAPEKRRGRSTPDEDYRWALDDRRGPRDRWVEVIGRRRSHGATSRRQVGLRKSAESSLTAHLREALRTDQVRLEFQPEFDLQTRSVLAVEALVRWDHPELGQLEPIHFVQLAEADAAIEELGEWALLTACRQRAAWHAELPQLDFAVRVNVSPLQLDNPAFVDKVAVILSATGTRPADLCLEITERREPESVAVMAEVLAGLRTAGVKIALDDFGVGRNGLLRLREQLYDFIKIDQAFVRSLTPGSIDSSIVATVLRLAEELGLEVVAEGIDSDVALSELIRLGCRRGQGFLLGEPVSALAITALLAGAAPH